MSQSHTHSLSQVQQCHLYIGPTCSLLCDNDREKVLEHTNAHKQGCKFIISIFFIINFLFFFWTNKKIDHWWLLWVFWVSTLCSCLHQKQVWIHHQTLQMDQHPERPQDKWISLGDWAHPEFNQRIQDKLEDKSRCPDQEPLIPKWAHETGKVSECKFIIFPSSSSFFWFL